MKNQIFVTGHLNPDTDSIASAIGYAWLWTERDGESAVPARLGAINKQTTWVLQYLGLDAPVLITDASPRFESVVKRLDTVTVGQPLQDAWEIASRTGGIAPVLSPDGTPFGLMTGESLFRFMNEMMGPNPSKKMMSVAEILKMPAEQAVDTTVEKFQSSSRIRDLIKKVLREEGNDFWIIDENGKYVGIARQRDILNPPRIRLILVDHNEPQQSIAALEEAELLEILDHHRLANTPTNAPIRFTVEPVGSTSTLVTERIHEAGLAPKPDIAAVLLAGVISDTLNLISPTTTPRDHTAVQRLARWAFSPGTKYSDENIRTFAEKVLAAGSGLKTRSSEEIVSGDIKQYASGSLQFAVAQVEVESLYELEECRLEISEALEALRISRKLDFIILMVTDVTKGSSRLLMENTPLILNDLPYKLLADGTLHADGIVSRKKQLIPAILSLLEG